MEAELFEPDVHSGFVRTWLRERGFSEDDCEDLPGIGFVAFDRKLPVAVAFLRRCEGPYAMLDGLATNPNAPSKKRHLAIDLVVRLVIETGRELKLKKIIAYSIDAGTLKRSESHGFLKLPHTLIGLDLGVHDGFHRVTTFKR